MPQKTNKLNSPTQLKQFDSDLVSDSHGRLLFCDRSTFIPLCWGIRAPPPLGRPRLLRRPGLFCVLCVAFGLRLSCRRVGPSQVLSQAHRRALVGDSRDVIDTITGGPPKHYTQPDFGAACMRTRTCMGARA